MSRLLALVGIAILFVAGAAAQVQDPEENYMPGDIGIQCALAISSALQHLEKERPPGEENQPFNAYVRAEFGSVACGESGDEASVVLFPAKPMMGGDISYTIALEDLSVTGRTFGR